MKTIHFAAVIVLFTMSLAADVRGDDAAPSAQASQEDRIAALEAKLADAVARIEALEAAAAKPGQPPAVANDKPARPAPKPSAAAAKKDESASYFPKGAKIVGTFAGGASGNQAVEGTVLSRSASGAVLRITNLYGTHDWEVRIKGSKVTLVEMRTVARKVVGPSPIFSEIKVDGTIDAESLSISGNWRVKNGAGTKTSNVQLDVHVR
jgi:hypothetical protein